MAFNKNSNGFTFFFAIAMVVIVGAVLAVTSVSLKPLQKANRAEKKMINILGAIGIPAERGGAAEVFAQYVSTRIAIDSEGREVGRMTGDVDASNADDPFNIDIQKDFRSKAPASELTFPLFECISAEGEVLLVVPVVGTGLWGPIWGFVALKGDGETIYGAVFDHKTETPGLGAEIREGFFQVKFKGKKINTAGSPYFEVRKGGAVTDEYSVDGITGGTITSKGVGNMMDRTMGFYMKYFAASQAAQITE
jgi:Na+-transporting NADH:ubiquinone oxidoreductase subunit C